MRIIQLFTILCLPFLALAQKNKSSVNVQSKNITVSNIDFRKIDSLIKPFSASTEMWAISTIKELTKIDLLDGAEDKQVSNFIGGDSDAFITKELYQNGYKALFFIENQEFHNNPSINLQTKIKYIKHIGNVCQNFLKSTKQKENDLSVFKNVFINFKDICYYKKLDSVTNYLIENKEASIFINKDLYSSDLKLLNIVVENMCNNHPQILGNNLTELSKYASFCKVINYLAVSKANTILTYINSENDVAKKIKQCDNELLSSINKIANESKYGLRTIALLSQIHNKKMTIKEADEIAKDDNLYFKNLINLYESNEPISRNVIARDLEVIAKKYVEKINELHDNGPEVRFRSIEPLTAKQIYYLITNTNDEIYTSSFIGLYNRMVQKMKPLKGDEFLQELKMAKFRTFLRMCANFNTLTDFLSTLNPAMKNNIMFEFVKGLGDNKKVNLEGAVDVADSFGSIDDKELLTFLKQEIENELATNQASKNKNGYNVYYILNNLVSFKLDPSQPMDPNVPIIDRVLHESLLDDSTKIINEQMFFYGDSDGIGAYNAYIKRFYNNNWKVDNTNPYYIIITSTNSKIPYRLFINKPLPEPRDETAQMLLMDYLAENDINPTIIVHRGHSYHLPNTLNALNEKVKIVILGSCGGYHNLSTIINRSPQAHIVSTKQIGAGKINGPILDNLHNKVQKGEDINWVKMWAELGKTFTGNSAAMALFPDYIPPYKNLGALFLQTFNKLSGLN